MESNRLKFLLEKMKRKHIIFEYINDKPELFEYMV